MRFHQILLKGVRNEWHAQRVIKAQPSQHKQFIPNARKHACTSVPAQAHMHATCNLTFSPSRRTQTSRNPPPSCNKPSSDRHKKAEEIPLASHVIILDLIHFHLHLCLKHAFVCMEINLLNDPQPCARFLQRCLQAYQKRIYQKKSALALPTHARTNMYISMVPNSAEAGEYRCFTLETCSILFSRTSFIRAWETL